MPVVPGCGESGLCAVDVAKVASVAVAVVDADLSRWIAASVLFGWFATRESSPLC